VVGLANAGGDASNAIKQAYEFGLQAGGQTIVPLLIGAGDLPASACRLQPARSLRVDKGECPLVK
jgi:branched-chain amino acid transport system substrate-binding protein